MGEADLLMHCVERAMQMTLSRPAICTRESVKKYGDALDKFYIFRIFVEYHLLLSLMPDTVEGTASAIAFRCVAVRTTHTEQLGELVLDNPRD